MTGPSDGAAAFRAARDLLLEHATDYEAAVRDFAWPALDEFNWALDYFDAIEERDRTAIRIVEADGADVSYSFREMTERSNRVANYFRSLGIGRGDRILLMLGNEIALWESMLAAMKLGAVLIPATTLLVRDDLADRIERGHVRAVVAGAELAPRFEGLPGAEIRIAVRGRAAGWHAYDDAAAASAAFTPDAVTRASDPFLLYFTSGTTAKPKLVEHTHESYPVGHLSTMYWIGLRPGDVHLNISSPGWAKHAWSSFFAPWNAGATILVYNYARLDVGALLDAVERTGVTTFCAPPTVWRMLIQADLAGRRGSLRELVGAGEPLNPEVIQQVRSVWGITIRDGYGQTETTAQIANPPGQEVRLGSMGRPLPGYRIALVDPLTAQEAAEGEICLDLAARPTGLMVGYRDDPARTAEVMRDGYYHTGDVAGRDADGYVTYVGRTDDVFKSSDYRISPFELESVLIEHPDVVEAAVVPSPDPVRLSVPKAYIVLRAGCDPSAATAASIFAFCRERLSPYKRVRRIEFADLPKTISGKIRRVELRRSEETRPAAAMGERREAEFWEEDLRPVG